MYFEMGSNKLASALWLKRAERIDKAAVNHINLADVRMVPAFWHRVYGSHEVLIKTLDKAVVEFRQL